MGDRGSMDPCGCRALLISSLTNSSLLSEGRMAGEAGLLLKKANRPVLELEGLEDDTEFVTDFR